MGAQVSRVDFDIPGGHPAGCSFPGRMPPGATAWEPPPYCMDFDSPGAPPAISVTITYYDEEGRSGSVRASAPVVEIPTSKG